MSATSLSLLPSLYKVTCQGMELTHGTGYIVAPDAQTAYRKLRAYLDMNDFGFEYQRELHRVILIASAATDGHLSVFIP